MSPIAQFTLHAIAFAAAYAAGAALLCSAPQSRRRWRRYALAATGRAMPASYGWMLTIAAAAFVAMLICIG